MNTPEDNVCQLHPAPVLAQLDLTLAQRAFERAAADYNRHAWLQEEMGKRLLERLDEVKIAPQTIVDMGCGTGLHTMALKNHFPKAKVIGIDFAAAMLTEARKRNRWNRKVEYRQAEMQTSGLKDASVDLIFSNASLQWVPDLRALFNEWRRIMKPGGLLMFTTFGPLTLQELREAWSKVDNKTHVNPFLDIRDVGDTLLSAGFSEPVMDAELLTLTYTSVYKLMAELKGMGAQNVNQDRQHSLTGAGRLGKMCNEYKEFCQPDGRYPASWELIYGVAWQPDEGQPIRTGAGEEASFSIAHLLGSRKKPK